MLPFVEYSLNPPSLTDRYPVSFYRVVNSLTAEIMCLCKDCAALISVDDELEIIDTAGAWDECTECQVQNVPS